LSYFASLGMAMENFSGSESNLMMMLKSDSVQILQ
jgi:hypothetical protein